MYFICQSISDSQLCVQTVVILFKWKYFQILSNSNLYVNVTDDLKRDTFY